MKKFYLFAILLIASTSQLSAKEFKISSPDFKKNGNLSLEQTFNGFGCSGANLSPELTWEGAPKDTKSFAVTVFDPDAPTGSGWWHWTVVNIPTNVTSLPKGAGSDLSKLPQGALQGRTDFGKPGFGGACPPAGDKPHKYIFTVYALKVEKLDLDENASGAMVGFNLKFNSIAKASITAKFGRKNKQNY